MSQDKSAATPAPGTVKPKKAQPQPQPQPAARPASNPNSPLNRASKYLGEVRTELKKTTWPSKEETIVQTQVVIGLLIVVGVFIAAWDFILSQIFAGLLAIMGVRVGK